VDGRRLSFLKSSNLTGYKVNGRAIRSVISYKDQNVRVKPFAVHHRGGNQ
jgi:hypothetical protein